MWGAKDLRRHFVFIGALAFILTIGAFAFGQQAATKTPAHSTAAKRGAFHRPPAYPPRAAAPPAEVAHGKQLFEANCSFCHGADARGGETGPNLVRAQVAADSGDEP